MWNVKAKVIPIIRIGATGTISQSLRQYLSNRPGKQEIKLTTENSHIGHCTHTLESADVKVQNVFHWAITLHVAQTVNTEQLQHYIP